MQSPSLLNLHFSRLTVTRHVTTRLISSIVACTVSGSETYRTRRERGVKWESAPPWGHLVQSNGSGSHEPGDGTGQEVLVTEPHVARHAGVLLPEDLRHGLQLRAHLDEAVQLDSGTLASQCEALDQRLGELGAEVVAHLGQG